MSSVAKLNSVRCLVEPHKGSGLGAQHSQRTINDTSLQLQFVMNVICCDYNF